MENYEDEEEDMLVSQLNMDISNQYVVFSIADEEYGVPILSVQEIISLPNLTRVPGVPEYISGLINLRGNIIPLYVLRSRFHLEEKELNDNSIVIIAQTGNDNLKTIGFIVDSVSDVLSITKENLSETPEFSSTIDVNFIEKIGKVGNRMVIIINMKNFLTEDETSVLESVVAKA
ncbi:MAG: chemotaxis protein CheW [Spirochaetaceae bacterium]